MDIRESLARAIAPQWVPISDDLLKLKIKTDGRFCTVDGSSSSAKHPKKVFVQYGSCSNIFSISNVVNGPFRFIIMVLTILSQFVLTEIFFPFVNKGAFRHEGKFCQVTKIYEGVQNA